MNILPKKAFRNSVSLLWIISAFLLLSCQSAQKLDKTIVGKWSILNGKIIEIYNDGKYTLKPGGNFGVYSGEYWIAHDTVTFVDIFCGTKLPGKYCCSIAGDSMTLDLIKDDYCGRADFFPGVWKKIKY